MNPIRNRLTPTLVCLLLLLISLPTASAYYDPGVQRWINRDPLGEQARAQTFLSETAGVESNANPTPFDALEGPNPYAFVHNQPTIGYDADGLLAESPECLAARISANILRRLVRRYPANTYYSALYTYAAASEILFCGPPFSPGPMPTVPPCPFRWGRPPYSPPWGPGNPWNRTPLPIWYPIWYPILIYAPIAVAL
jgi:hypothetical protein